MAFVDALRPLRIACLYGVFTERHDAFVRKVLGTTFRSVHVGDLLLRNYLVLQLCVRKLGRSSVVDPLK